LLVFGLVNLEPLSLMMSNTIEIKSTTKIFGGNLIRLCHQSAQTGTLMTLAIFLPPHAERTDVNLSIPFIMYLSGLTCTDENVCQKSGIFGKLAQKGLGFIAPDTSPRGAGVTGEDDSWDFGTGAGFYLDATSDIWSQNYRMYSYIVEEIPALLATHFPCLDQSRVGITGHSMGGHGALTIALKNQSKFK
jgi:S-formylglutathione hydrolase